MAVWRCKIPHVEKYFNTWREISYLQAVMYIMFSLFYKNPNNSKPFHFNIFLRLFREKGTVYYIFIFWRWLGIFMHEDVVFYFWKVIWYFIFVYVIIMVKVIARQTDIPLWYGRAPRLKKTGAICFPVRDVFSWKSCDLHNSSQRPAMLFFHWIPWTNTKLFVKEFIVLSCSVLRRFKRTV